MLKKFTLIILLLNLTILNYGLVLLTKNKKLSLVKPNCSISIDDSKNCLDKHYLYEYIENSKCTEKTIELLLKDINNGGYLLYENFQGNKITWFTKSNDLDKPLYDLITHMKALVCLYKFFKTTHEKRYYTLFKQGLTSLKLLLPLFDTGYWFKKNLKIPSKISLRINNPYGFEIYPLKIKEISLSDPISKTKYFIKLGYPKDFAKNQKIYIW